MLLNVNHFKLSIGKGQADREWALPAVFLSCIKCLTFHRDSNIQLLISRVHNIIVAEAHNRALTYDI